MGRLDCYPVRGEYNYISDWTAAVYNISTQYICIYVYNRHLCKMCNYRAVGCQFVRILMNFFWNVELYLCICRILLLVHNKHSVARITCHGHVTCRSTHG